MTPNDTITRLIQAAEQAREALQIGQDAFSQAFGGYGFYRPDNPHNFFPDPECCTPEEIANHSKACEAYDKGTYVPDHKDGWITPEIHVTAAPWGIGTYTDECKEISDSITALRAAIEAAKQEREAEPVIDPNCTCDPYGACAYCWNGKKHDTTPQPQVYMPVENTPERHAAVRRVLQHHGLTKVGDAVLEADLIFAVLSAAPKGGKE